MGQSRVEGSRARSSSRGRVTGGSRECDGEREEDGINLMEKGGLKLGWIQLRSEEKGQSGPGRDGAGRGGSR